MGQPEVIEATVEAAVVVGRDDVVTDLLSNDIFLESSSWKSSRILRWILDCLCRALALL
jgi:hypothetical protein